VQGLQEVAVGEGVAGQAGGREVGVGFFVAQGGAQALVEEDVGGEGEGGEGVGMREEAGGADARWGVLVWRLRGDGGIGEGE